MKGARSYSEDASEAVEYEKLRNARLLENRKRMEDLGLKGLAQQLKESSTPPLSASRPSSRLRDPPSHRLPAPVGPSRRSSRLVHTRNSLFCNGFSFWILRSCFCFSCICSFEEFFVD